MWAFLLQFKRLGRLNITYSKHKFNFLIHNCNFFQTLLYTNLYSRGPNSKPSTD